MTKLFIVFIIGCMVKLFVGLYNHNTRDVSIGIKLIHKSDAVTLLSGNNLIPEFVVPWIVFLLLTFFIFRDKTRQ